MTSPNLTFAKEPGLGTVLGVSGAQLYIFTAVVTGTLTSEVITIHNSAADTTALAWALVNAKNSAPFDVNAAIPNAQSNTGVSAKITTSSTKSTFAFGVAYDYLPNLPTGYRNLSAAALSTRLVVNYRIATGPLTNDQFTTNTTVLGSIATAIVVP